MDAKPMLEKDESIFKISISSYMNHSTEKLKIKTSMLEILIKVHPTMSIIYKSNLFP
jgi:hypothetical protein